MTFGQGPYITAKIKNSSKTSKKNIVTFKVHDMNREGLN